MAGERGAGVRVGDAGDVPGEVVGADEQRLARRDPRRGRAGDPARRLVGRPVAPTARPSRAARAPRRRGAARRPRPRARAPRPSRRARRAAARPRARPPRRAARRAPRSGGIVSAPSAVNPVEVCTRASTSTPPCRRRSSAWWQSASMCVPECSAITSSADALVRASPRPASWRRCSDSTSPARGTGTSARPRSAAARGRRRGRSRSASASSVIRRGRTPCRASPAARPARRSRARSRTRRRRPRRRARSPPRGTR